MRQIFGLTCLRGLAAIWVVLYHIRKHFGAGLDFQFLAKGNLAVDLFFVLSGFVLAYVYLPSIKRGDFSFKSFIVKRLARIYPVHFVTMVLALIVILGGSFAGLTSVSVPDQAKALLANTLLLHAFGMGSRVLMLNYPSWSISAEFFVYLLFFPLMIACRKIPGALIFAALFFVGTVMASPYLFDQPFFELSSFGLPRVLPEFVMGIALFLSVQGKRVSSRWIAAVPLLIVVPVVLLASDLAFVFGAAACVAILYMADHGQPWRALLPLQHLGVISYSVYMVHALVEMTSFKVMERMFGIQEGAFPLVFLPLILVAIIGCGHFCWRFVEQPAHRLFLRSALEQEAPGSA